MKIEKNYLLLCENFFTDDKQRATIVNIYDNIWGQQFPVMHPMMKYASSIKILNSGSQKSIDVQLSLASTGGSEVFASPVQSPPIMPRQEVQHINVIFEVQGVVFPHEGKYEAVLKVNGSPVATSLVEVKSVPPPEA